MSASSGENGSAGPVGMNGLKSAAPSASSAKARADASSSKHLSSLVWTHYLSAAILGGVLLGGLLRWALLDWSDPLRCDKYLGHGGPSRGKWLDNGVWKNWQPDGCIHSPPDSKIFAKCFAQSSKGPSSASNSLSYSPRANHILFIGDSTTRQLFFASAKLADPSLPGTTEDAGGEKHSDRSLTVTLNQGSTTQDIHLEFWWDPFLNSSRTTGHLSRSSSSPSGLLVLGSGLWYLRHPSSGGIAAWTQMVDNVFEYVAASQPILSSRALNKPPPFLTSSSSGLADAVVFLPVTTPVDNLLAESRRTISHSDVEAMNADLAARSTFPTAPLKVPMAFNELLVEAETEDGLHFSEKIVKKQAEILFGWRCNNVASEMNGACCKRYASIRPIQLLVLFFVCAWAPLGLILHRRNLSIAMSIFGLGILYMFLADRTTVFLKEQKQYSPWIFGFLTLASLAAGLATMVRRDKDMGFLNREQTDEWKGWMQVAILIYHWYGASKVSGIYNAIRVLVASYLFMTGYYKKEDFGFQRVAMVMVRLNLLSIILPYTMNTDYAFYYFAPLVSWWYTIIYVTMWAGHQYNDKPVFMLGKLTASAVGIALFMKHIWILEHIFSFLNTVFNIQWSAREWSFRVSLDLYIVYGGMLCSYLFIKINDHRMTTRAWWPFARNIAIGLSLLALTCYFYFELTLPNKFVYNQYHAIVSFVPIFGFIILRNATPLLRSCSSRFFMFIGQCSLETFILQFHMWMASDTRAVLMVIPYVSWRPLNLLISTIPFIWLSYKVSIATGEITEWAVGKPKTAAPRLPAPATHPGSHQGAGSEAADPAKTSNRVPEAIPLMKIGEGRDEMDEPLATTSRRPEPNPVSRAVSAVYSTAKSSVPARLGLALLGLWVMNLLY